MAETSSIGPRLVVILGPTASGKSALAMAVAGRLGADILSVDSMQVYAGMDVGTAKPTADERQRVRHHLVDVAGPDEAFTVAQFVDRADRVIADAEAAGRPLVVTGGTPLYYKALFEGLFDGPARTTPCARDSPICRPRPCTRAWRPSTRRPRRDCTPTTGGACCGRSKSSNSPAAPSASTSGSGHAPTVMRPLGSG